MKRRVKISSLPHRDSVKGIKFRGEPSLRVHSQRTTRERPPRHQFERVRGPCGGVSLSSGNGCDKEDEPSSSVQDGWRGTPLCSLSPKTQCGGASSLFEMLHLPLICAKWMTGREGELPSFLSSLQMLNRLG